MTLAVFFKSHLSMGVNWNPSTSLPTHYYNYAITLQVQLLELMEQFYASLLLQDDQIVEAKKAPDDADDDEPLSLHVSSELRSSGGWLDVSTIYVYVLMCLRLLLISAVNPI